MRPRRPGFHIANAWIGLLLAVPALRAGTFGDNLLPPPPRGADGAPPPPWRCTLRPPGTGRCVVESGKEGGAVILEAADEGDVRLASPVVPLGAPRQYLLAASLRAESIADAGARLYLHWVDGTGARLPDPPAELGLYLSPAWSVCHTICRAPETARGAQWELYLRGRTNGDPETAVRLLLLPPQMRPYDPPPAPAWATQSPVEVVDGDRAVQRVEMYDLAGLRYADASWNEIVDDPAAEGGMAVCNRPQRYRGGMLAVSDYLPQNWPGLYRLQLRCRAGEGAPESELGSLLLDSAKGAPQGRYRLRGDDLGVGGGYVTRAFDFVMHRTDDFWRFLLITNGRGRLFADTVRVYRLRDFTDREICDLFPIGGRIVAPALRPETGKTVRGLIVCGPGYERFGLARAFRLAWRYQTLHPLWPVWDRAQTVPEFPREAEALFRHRVVCLANMEAAALSLRQKRLLVEYVRRGGGLLVFGGHRAFGRGGWTGSLLEDLLPVTCRTPAGGALLHDPGGVPLRPAANFAARWFTSENEAPRAYWIHDVQPRGKGEVLLQAEERPVVIRRRYGEGRVVCVALAPHGPASDSAAAFWQWRSWPLLMRDCLWWAAGEEHRFERGARP